MVALGLHLSEVLFLALARFLHVKHLVTRCTCSDCVPDQCLSRHRFVRERDPIFRQNLNSGGHVHAGQVHNSPADCACRSSGVRCRASGPERAGLRHSDNLPAILKLSRSTRFAILSSPLQRILVAFQRNRLYVRDLIASCDAAVVVSFYRN